MSIGIISIVASVFALAAAVLAFIFIIPAKKRAKLNGFGKVIHDILNFKHFYVEYALKFLYVLSTASSIILGFMMLFWVEEYGYYSYYSSPHYEWLGYYGLIVMIAGPIGTRVTYEFLMMFVLACKNIIQINNKIPENCETNEVKADDKKEAPVATPYATAPTAPTAAPETESFYHRF